MSTQMDEKTVQTGKKRGRGTTILIILLVIFLFLFLLSTIILAARLYDMATRDQFSVNMGLGNPDGELELFKIEYANDTGDITVQGITGDKVVAPGTSISYDIRLKNQDDAIIDFVMQPKVTFHTEDPVPIRFKLMDTYGNYILGSETDWAEADAMNTVTHRGAIHPGEIYTYALTWEWVFEVDEAGDIYDTYLGDQTGDVLPGLEVSILTESTARPVAEKGWGHMMHLFGEGFGCCWCCYLVWILLLIIIILIIIIWLPRRKKKLENPEEAADL